VRRATEVYLETTACVALPVGPKGEPIRSFNASGTTIAEETRGDC
jgi:hypothetical protein